MTDRGHSGRRLHDDRLSADEIRAKSRVSFLLAGRSQKAWSNVRRKRGHKSGKPCPRSPGAHFDQPVAEEAGWRFPPDAQGRKDMSSASTVSGKAFATAPTSETILRRRGRVRRLRAAEYGWACGGGGRSEEGENRSLTAKEQARAYAERLGPRTFSEQRLVHLLLESAPGKYGQGVALPAAGTTRQAAEWRPDSTRLASVKVDENTSRYRRIRLASYSPADRAAVMGTSEIRLLRDYQIEAMRALQKAASPSQHRFLSDGHRHRQDAPERRHRQDSISAPRMRRASCFSWIA